MHYCHALANFEALEKLLVAGEDEIIPWDVYREMTPKPHALENGRLTMSPTRGKPVVLF